jgi:hypothetical protein
VYRQCRVADGSIGPLEIRVVELMDDAVSRGSSVGQSMVELLDSRVASNHVSPKLPHWCLGERFQLDLTTSKESSPSTSTHAVA